MFKLNILLREHVKSSFWIPIHPRAVVNRKHYLYVADNGFGDVTLRKNIAPLMLFIVTATLLLIPSAYAYHNDKYNFSVTPPDDWLAKEQTEGAAVVVFTDSFVAFTGASINIAVEETSKTLSEVTAQAKQELNNTLDNWQLVSEGIRVINSVNCYEILGTWNYSMVEMKSKQVLVVEDGKMFVLSCASLKEQYAQSETDFENCLASFKIEEETSQTGATFGGTLTIIIAAAVIAAVIGIVVILMPKKKHKHR